MISLLVMNDVSVFSVLVNDFSRYFNRDNISSCLFRISSSSPIFNAECVVFDFLFQIGMCKAELYEVIINRFQDVFVCNFLLCNTNFADAIYHIPAP